MRNFIRENSDKPSLILDFSHVNLMDETGALSLQDLVLRMQDKGKSVYIGGLKRKPLRMLIKMGVVDSLGRTRVCKSLKAAMERASEETVQNDEEQGLLGSLGSV